MPYEIDTCVKPVSPAKRMLMSQAFHYPANLLFVDLAILTSESMMGTSVSTPTVVARAAPLCMPNRLIATATASSKKLEAPIIPAGAAML